MQGVRMGKAGADDQKRAKQDCRHGWRYGCRIDLG
jgi:hypothetical protein